MAHDLQPGLPAPFPDPAIHNALRNQRVMILNEDGTGLMEGRVHLHRHADDVERAYQLIASKLPVSDLPFGGCIRHGLLRHARILERVPNAETQLMTFQKTRNRVIIKQLFLNLITPYLGQGGAENPYIEISAMQHYGDGTHIIQCVEALRDNEYLYLITPYHPHGDLFANINWGHGGYSRATPTQAVMQRLAENVLYMHHPHRRLIHRDLSPENVLVDDNHAAFPMIDFAMSLRCSENGGFFIPPNRPHGKLPYMAPEAAYPGAFGGLIGEPINVWILGVIFFNILTGSPLYESPADLSFVHLVNHGLPNDARTQGLDPAARDLLDRMMQWLPEDRIPSDQILVHPWFTAGGGD